MTKQEEYGTLLIGILRNYCPKDTLQEVNSIRLSYNTNNVTITIGQGVVSSNGYNYTNRTNDVWKKGTNPNQGWVDKAIKQATMIFCAKYGGASYGL